MRILIMIMTAPLLLGSYIKIGDYMSFREAYVILKQQEGGYINHKNDKGGETYAGISRKFHPDWEGWAMVDYYKKSTKSYKELNKLLSKDFQIRDMKARFYKSKFWDKIDKYPFSKDIKIFLFDYAVNSGHKNAFKALQRALNVRVDGVIGEGTLQAYMSAKTSLIAELKKQRDKFYKGIIKRDKSQKVFENGWLKRSHNVMCHSIDCSLVHKVERPEKRSWWTRLFKGE